MVPLIPALIDPDVNFVSSQLPSGEWQIAAVFSIGGQVYDFNAISFTAAEAHRIVFRKLVAEFRKVAPLYEINEVRGTSYDD